MGDGGQPCRHVRHVRQPTSSRLPSGDVCQVRRLSRGASDRYAPHARQVSRLSSGADAGYAPTSRRAPGAPAHERRARPLHAHARQVRRLSSGAGAGYAPHACQVRRLSSGASTRQVAHPSKAPPAPRGKGHARQGARRRCSRPTRAPVPREPRKLVSNRHERTWKKAEETRERGVEQTRATRLKELKARERTWSTRRSSH